MGISPLTAPVLITQGKQTASSDIQHSASPSIKKIVKFTRTHSWLTTLDTVHKFKTMGILPLPFIVSCIAMIPGLPAVPQELACAVMVIFDA